MTLTEDKSERKKISVTKDKKMPLGIAGRHIEVQTDGVVDRKSRNYSQNANIGGGYWRTEKDIRLYPTQLEERVLKTENDKSFGRFSKNHNKS